MHCAEALVQFFEPCEATGMEDFSSLIQSQVLIDFKLHLYRHYVLRKANSHLQTSIGFFPIFDPYCGRSGWEGMFKQARLNTLQFHIPSSQGGHSHLEL